MTAVDEPDWQRFKRRLMSRYPSGVSGDSGEQEDRHEVEAGGFANESGVSAEQRQSGVASAARDGYLCSVSEVEEGGLLVAMPNVLFVKQPSLGTSVLLVVHKARGRTFSIALNRPSVGNVTLGAALKSDELQRAFGQRPLNVGGSQLSEGMPSVWMLTTHRGLPGSVELADGVYSGNATEAAARVNAGLAEASEFHFYAGYFAWEDGALAKEIEAGAWAVARCDGDALRRLLQLDEESPDEKHARALRALGVPAKASKRAESSRDEDGGGTLAERMKRRASDAEGSGNADADSEEDSVGGVPLDTRKLAEALELWTSLVTTEVKAAMGEEAAGAEADAADKDDLSLEVAMGRMHRLLNGDLEERAGDSDTMFAWLYFDDLALRFRARLREMWVEESEVRVPVLQRWLGAVCRWVDSLTGWGDRSPLEVDALDAMYALRSELRRLIGADDGAVLGGEDAVLDGEGAVLGGEGAVLGGEGAVLGGERVLGSPRRLSDSSLTHLLIEIAAESRREKKRKVSPAADDEAGESENRRPLGGELSLSLLALLLAERVGLPAQLLSSDEGWFLMVDTWDEEEGEGFADGASVDEARGDSGSVGAGPGARAGSGSGAVFGIGAGADIGVGAIVGGNRTVVGSELERGILGPLKAEGDESGGDGLEGERFAFMPPSGPTSGARGIGLRDGRFFMQLKKGDVGSIMTTEELLQQVAPASSLLWDEPLPASALPTFAPQASVFEIAQELAHSWSLYFAEQKDKQQATFWKLQSLLLDRLLQRTKAARGPPRHKPQFDSFDLLEKLEGERNLKADDDKFGI